MPIIATTKRVISITIPDIIFVIITIYYCYRVNNAKTKSFLLLSLQVIIIIITTMIMIFIVFNIKTDIIFL